jgi:hypothetical protein
MQSCVGIESNFDGRNFRPETAAIASQLAKGFIEG